MRCVHLPLHSIQLVSVFPGHQQTSSPRTLHGSQHGNNTEHIDIDHNATANCWFVQLCVRFLHWRSIFSYIHMKPHIVLFTDVGNFIDGIKGSVDGGTSGGSHKQWNIPLWGKSTAHTKKKKTILGWIQVMFFSFSLIVDIKEMG